MKLFHRTAAVEQILRDGFRDATGTYLTNTERTGVWFSDRPIGANEGAEGPTVLTIDIPTDAVTNCEWIEESIHGFKGFREFLVPAALANQYGPPTVHDDDWDSHSRDSILEIAENYRKSGCADKADELIAHFEFLQRHGFLRNEPPTAATGGSTGSIR